MSSNRVLNFNPGPAVLPPDVLEEIRDKFMNFGGMSVLEISHRSKEFENIIGQAEILIRELMGVPKNYQVLFLQGGASLQFAMVPMNLMQTSASYSITGYWSKKALKEASIVGESEVVFSNEAENFVRVPRPNGVRQTGSYLHITSNNTIYGTQYSEFPSVETLVADMSSDIMSRVIDVSQFGLIYAGAQKNLGPAGVTLVIIRDDLVARKYRSLPTMLSYSTHVEQKSLYNTPPVFAIYVMLFVLRWIKRKGGVSSIEKINDKKASLLYSAIDESKIYTCPAEVPSRSKMNVVFKLPTEELTKKFLSQATQLNMIGLAGHRVLGGVRASIYNALPAQWVCALVDFMKEFERKA